MAAVNGSALRLRREGAGLTVKDFAAALDCDATTITKIELGQRDPSVELLTRITARLGCTADELLRAAS
jgi:transcriptional regulator with XRE-family HTH domain